MKRLDLFGRSCYRVAALALFLVLTPACSDDDTKKVPIVDAAVASCSSANCSGCCRNNQCIQVPTDSACGLGGAACASCNLGQECKYGTCAQKVTLCNGSTCSAGCCENGVCQGGNTNTACGISGGPCTNCQLLGGTCDVGIRSCKQQTRTCAESCPGCCVGESCLAGNTSQACGLSGGSCSRCQAPESCSGGICGSTGGGPTYAVYLERVTVPNPYVVCLGSECDLQVVMQVGNQGFKSSVKTGSDVIFDEKLPIAIAESDLLFSFKFDVYDESDFLPVELLCTGTPHLTLAQLNGQSLTIPCISIVAAVAQVNFRFEKL